MLYRSRFLCGCSLFVLLGLFPESGQAAYPQWWLEHDVVGESPPPGPGDTAYDENNSAHVEAWQAWMADNYVPANLGQAKNLAQAAYNTMETAETGSAGTHIQAMVASFSTAPEDNYVPLNLGQLKALAKPFYDRMHDANYPVTLAGAVTIPSGTYPWNPSTPVSENYAPANLGQLKHLFSFKLVAWPPNSGDSDNNGLPDWWELYYFGTLGIDPHADPDGDGLTNLQEYLAGTNPLVYDLPADLPAPPDAFMRAYVYLVKPDSISYAVVGQSISLQAVAGFPGDTVAEVLFQVDGSSHGSGVSLPPYEWSWTPVSPGLYVLNAVATSASSMTVTSASVIIEVQTDTNANGLGDAWESETGMTNPAGDGDGDGLTALEEYQMGLSPGTSDHPAVGLQFFSINI